MTSFIGRVYKITSNETADIYVGSTVQKLYQRFSNHKLDYTKYTQGKFAKYMTSYCILKYSDAKIELLEERGFEYKNDMLKLEGEYIRAIEGCINKQVAGRTEKEYKDTYKDQYKQYNKEYNETHKDRISQQHKEYYQANKDEIKQHVKQYKENHEYELKIKNKEYNNKHKEEIKQYKKGYRELNKDKIAEVLKEYYNKNQERLKEQKNAKITCEICGTMYSHSNKNKHIKAKTHQLALERKKEPEAEPEASLNKT
jgi:hypothetical protein